MDYVRFEVLPSEKYMENNPYRASIVCENDSPLSGKVRIEPPVVSVSDRYLELLRGDIGVELEFLISDQHASLFNVFANEESGTFDMTDEEQISHTVQCLLNDLGKTASRALYDSHPL